MSKHIPLNTFPEDVKVAAHMIGLDYKNPYVRHGKKYYKPYRNYFDSALSGRDYETLCGMEKAGYVKRTGPNFTNGVVFRLTREGLDWLGNQLGVMIYDRGCA